jgi:nucleotide-binding universal stress UspA family protein
MMTKLLVPIYGSPDQWRAALAQATEIHRRENASVHLLSVQPKVSGHVSMFFGRGELQQIQQAAGLEDLEPAQALLRTAGVPFTSSVMVGRSAETIARAAREFGCQRVIMGGEGEAPRSVFGSVATQVRHILSSGNDCQVIGS